MLKWKLDLYFIKVFFINLWIIFSTFQQKVYTYARYATMQLFFVAF